MSTLLAVLVTAASVQDSTVGRTLLAQAAADHPGLRKVWVDGGYRKHFIEHTPPRHRPRNRPTQARDPGVHTDPETLDRRADLRLADAPPPPRT